MPPVDGHLHDFSEIVNNIDQTYLAALTVSLARRAGVGVVFGVAADANEKQEKNKKDKETKAVLHHRTP